MSLSKSEIRGGSVIICTSLVKGCHCLLDYYYGEVRTHYFNHTKKFKSVRKKLFSKFILFYKRTNTTWIYHMHNILTVVLSKNSFLWVKFKNFLQYSNVSTAYCIHGNSVNQDHRHQGFLFIFIPACDDTHKIW